MFHHIPIATVMLTQEVIKEMKTFQLLTIIIRIVGIIVEVLQQVHEITEQLILIHARLDDANIPTLGKLTNCIIIQHRYHFMIHKFKGMAKYNFIIFA